MRSKTSASARLEGSVQQWGTGLEPWLGVLGWVQMGFLVMEGFLMDTWRLSRSCLLSFSWGTSVGWGSTRTQAGVGAESAHPREAESSFSSIKWPQGICGVCLEKPQLGELNPSGLLVLQKRVLELTQAMLSRARERFWLRNYFVSILLQWMFHEAFDSFRFSCLENIDHGFG